MDLIEKITEIANKNNGVILTKQVTNAGYHRGILKRMENEGLITQIQRGVYVTEHGYADDFFLIQQVFRKGIFSHETALYLHGFSDRTPFQFNMTFKQGTSTSRMKAENVKPVMISKDFELGLVTLIRNGLTIKVYEMERTLVDLLKPRYSADLEQLIPAFKKYAQYENRDINKLFRYANHFGVEEKIRTYIGVLL